MGNYDPDIESTWIEIKSAGAQIDVIRPVEASYDPGDDVYIYTSGDLSGELSATAATLNLTNITNGPFPAMGILTVGTELIKYLAASGATLSTLTRGFKGTTPAIHSAGAAVKRIYETFVSYGVFTGYKTKEIDGHNIMKGDKRILIPAKNAAFDIDTESLIVHLADEYQVVDTQVTAPDAVSKILYKVQGR